ncbi:MAG: chromate transporter [Oscillospiraceae bacterium]|nr:chromate transporter [Oscillospiraceae bacterium]
MICLELFLAFLQVGLFTFGGGYAAIPLIRDVVMSRGWLSESALTDMIAVSESTPGPIMVNMATYVGSSQAGLPGALTATAAVVLPSFLIILLVTAVLKSLLKHPYMQAALRGLKPGITGIIAATGIRMLLTNCVPAGQADFSAITIAALLVVAMAVFRKLRKKKLSPIALIVLSAFLGILLYGL